MTDLILLWQADNDIQAAFNRCEEYQPGRGEIFMRHLDATFTVMRLHPKLARFYAAPYRRCLLRDFPYGIFYEAQPKRLIVAAIMDLRQDPRSILQKLGLPR